MIDLITDKNDNLKILFSIHSTSAEVRPNSEDTIVRITNIPIVLNFSSRKLLNIETFDTKNLVNYKHGEYEEVYSSYPYGLMPYHNDLIGMVRPRVAHYSSPVAANLNPDNDVYRITKFIDYPIDSSFIDNGIGAGMIFKKYSEPYFVEVYSKKIMNFDNGHFYKIPIDTKNNFTRQQFSDITIKPKYYIVSMYNDGEKLRIIADDDNALKQIDYMILKNGDLKYLGQEMITDDFFNSIYKNSLTCSKDGMYQYSSVKKEILFIPYK